MAFDAFLQQYGWLGFFAYVIVKEIIPIFRDKFLPHKLAEAKAERDRLKRLEERAITNEEKLTEAVESMSAMMKQFSLSMTINNERLTQLIAHEKDHDRFLNDALVAMRVKIAANTQPLARNDEHAD